MTSTQIVLTVFLAIVVVSISIAIGFAARRNALRRRFGPEYERVAGERESRMAADRELADRRRRHNELQLRTIAPEARRHFMQRWQAVQAQFVDDPAGAVMAGDELIVELLQARGYPTRDYDDQVSMLSVEHAQTLGSYRDAHEIFLKARRGEATTEDLRQALVHYRDLFADLLGVQPASNADRTTARVSAPATGRASVRFSEPETGPAADVDGARARS